MSQKNLITIIAIGYAMMFIIITYTILNYIKTSYIHTAIYEAEINSTTIYEQY